MAVVLITGVSRYLGGRLAAHLAADPAVERVIGLDTAAPRFIEPDGAGTGGRFEFVRADLRNPLSGKVIAQAQVTAVVHAGLLSGMRPAGGRGPMQEMNVIGSGQLLGACQRSDTVERVVVASTAAVYGAAARTPGVLTEQMHPDVAARSGYARDAVDVEAAVRGFARRRPDIETTVLRFAPVLGPAGDSALGRYLNAAIVPTPAGFDPRLQLVHENDAVEILRRAAVSAHPGVYNVAGEGVLLLSQALRRLGRIPVPVPPSLLAAAGVVFGNAGVADFVAEQPGFLQHGRVLDTARLRGAFGVHPQYSTAAALASFGADTAPAPRFPLREPSAVGLTR